MDKPSPNLQPHENSSEELAKCSETPPRLTYTGVTRKMFVEQLSKCPCDIIGKEAYI